jgi:hypothetical protein
VIHAKSVEPETAAVFGDKPAPLAGRLVLYGDHRGKDWRAELDLKEYALTALRLTP